MRNVTSSLQPGRPPLNSMPAIEFIPFDIGEGAGISEISSDEMLVSSQIQRLPLYNDMPWCNQAAIVDMKTNSSESWKLAKIKNNKAESQKGKFRNLKELPHRATQPPPPSLLRHSRDSAHR